MEVYLENELIQHTFPLHDTVELESLGAKWYWALFQAQPFGKLQLRPYCLEVVI